MLRRVSAHSGSSRRNSASRRRKNGMTLREALQNRKRSNGSPVKKGLRLREALSKSRKSRSNGSPAESGLRLRDALKRSRKARRNAGDKSISEQALEKVEELKTALVDAENTANSTPTYANRKKVEALRTRLKTQLKKLNQTIASDYFAGARKAVRRKAAPKKRKAATTRKVSAKTGVAQETAAYKRLKKSSTKTKFTMAFNDAFKKARRQGNSAKAAQTSAIRAGSKAAKMRSNPSRATTLSAARSALARNAARVTRSNPKRKVAKRKKPVTSSAISAKAKQTSHYKRLRSEAKKKKFITAFKKIFSAQNRKRGVTEDMARARAALGAFSKANASTSSRKNPVAVGRVTRTPVARTNPKRKTRKAVKRKKPVISSAISAKAKQTSHYKRLRSAAKKKKFITAFKKIFSAQNRKRGVTEDMARARAALGAFSKANASSARKNPGCASSRSNPKRKVFARGKRMKRGMSDSAKKSLSVAGIYTYNVVINGKNVTIRANKNSTEYKKAKRGGLKAVSMTGLKSKLNTPTSLSLRSVSKKLGHRPSRAEYQKAISAWAGAIDGGKVRGVTKRDIQKSRMNPKKRARKHTIRALQNPAPLASPMMRSRMMTRSNERTGMDHVKSVGIGLGGVATGAYASNFLSSWIGVKAEVNDPTDDKKGAKFYAAELVAPLAIGGTAAWCLYNKSERNELNMSDDVAVFCGGLLAGSITSVLMRLVKPGISKIFPWLSTKGTAKGDKTFADVNAEKATAKATVAKGYLLDNQLQGVNGMSRLYGNHMGRYVRSNGAHNVGRYVTTDNQLGRYVTTDNQLGRYVSTNNDLGFYRASDNIGRYVSTPTSMGRANPSHPEGGVGANTQVAPITTQAINDGIYDIDTASLREDMELHEPLNAAELAAEGLEQVTTNGQQLKIVRCVPDVARQIAEANFGSIIGQSRVVPGAVLVLASIYDTPQAPVLTDRLRLNRAPEVPKGASYPQNGGVFSRVAFSSQFPSIDNQASYQEFGVRL